MPQRRIPLSRHCPEQAHPSAIWLAWCSMKCVTPTFIAWAKRRGIKLDHIQPGNPQQNAYIERYNRTVRYDWLSHYLFESIEEVQSYATDWMWTYNHERPNMALGGITPKQKSALLTRSTTDRC